MIPPVARFFVVATLISTSGYCSDEWIGLQQKTSWTAGLHLNHYESGDSSHDLYFFTTLPGSTYLNIQMGESTLEDNGNSFDSDSYLGQLGWSVSGEIDLGFSYQYQGKSQQLEIQQYAMQLDWIPYPAFAALEYSRGDVHVFTRDVNLPIRDIRNRVESDVQSYTFGVGYWFDAFSLSARHQRFDYELNFSRLDDSPILQLLLQPGALVQTDLLVSEQSSISLDYPLDKRFLAWHVLISRSALDNSETRALQFDWIEPLNRNSSLFVSLNRTDDEQDNWSFGVGLEWNS